MPKGGGPATAEDIPGFNRRTVHAGDLQYNGQGAAAPIPGTETTVGPGIAGMPPGAVVQRKPGGEASVLYTPPPGYASGGPSQAAPGPAGAPGAPQPPAVERRTAPGPRLERWRPFPAARRRCS
jgi:hypothetical protein